MNAIVHRHYSDDPAKDQAIRSLKDAEFLGEESPGDLESQRKYLRDKYNYDEDTDEQDYP